MPPQLASALLSASAACARVGASATRALEATPAGAAAWASSSRGCCGA